MVLYPAIYIELTIAYGTAKKGYAVKIVLVHYHLRPGGVTSVLRQQVAVLATLLPNAEITVLVGESDSSFDTLPATIVVDPNLDYFVPQSVEEALAKERTILKTFISQIGNGKTVFHIHNPTLAKNPCLTAAIHSLADRNVSIVSFCHDFSEDRPANQKINETYASWCNVSVNEFLYPDRKNIVYCTINSSDLTRLNENDFAKATSQLIPSPVQKPSPVNANREEIAKKINLDCSKEWYFYPVRAIERKNIGEFILMALLDNNEHEWILARRPANETEIPLYEQWFELATTNGITIHFDAVETVPFSDLMNSSDRIITTSTREGFGMAYLEPWLAGKPVAGREIPMVVNDMRNGGVIMDQLYTELAVPFEDSFVDFASLSPQNQLRLVEKCIHDQSLCSTIKARGSWWKKVTESVDQSVITTNITAIDREFSTETFGRRLVALYSHQ